MSKLAEMVEEESARAEAEPDEEEEVESEPEEEEVESEPEGEPEPEQPEQEAFAAIGPEEIKRAERAIVAQRKKLAGIFGEEAVAHDCLLCAGMGFLPELPPPGTTFSIEPSEGGYEFVAQAPRQEPPYGEARDKATCDWCDGWGFVLSGAKAEHSRVTPCSKCAGNGWVQKIVEGQAPAPGDGATPVYVAGEPEANPAMPPDQWGRPYGHQHWGVPPASIPG